MRFILLATLAYTLLPCDIEAEVGASVATDIYLREIKPLFKERCLSCHGALKQKGDLRLDTADFVRKSGDLDELIHRVTTHEKPDRMPPEGEGSLLSADQVERLKTWLAAGAPGPKDELPQADPRLHWAYQAPKSANKTLDNLLSSKLQAKGLITQPSVSPELWLRRVWLDLVGLPPPLDELTRFQKDHSPAARRRIVDQLLTTPQYGERWARHFMDIWRYTDWYGLGEQLRYSQKHIWHWRDWIVESLNGDKGYDQMIIEMIAGDELKPNDQATLRATGYLARDYYLFNRTTWLDASIEHTSRALLGITMQCVKCHDHKYDPIDQTDYYRIRAIFEPLHVRLDPVPGQIDLEKDGLPRVFDLHLERATYRHVRGDEKNVDTSKVITPGLPAVLEFISLAPKPINLPKESSLPALLPWVADDQLASAEAELARARRSYESVKDAQPATRQLAEKKLAAAEARPPMIKSVIAATTSPSDKNLTAAAIAASRSYALFTAEAKLLELEASKTDKKNEAAIKATLQQIKALKSTSQPTTVQPLQVSLKAQEGPDESTNAKVQTFPSVSTGRRLAYARWISDSRNPLTARVLVNHVWLRHFGSPLVQNVDDFGLRSTSPLHQDILDTLAVEFMRSGWSIKHLHRLMVLSDLYARSSSNKDVPSANLEKDPDNLYYWRMNSRRMESQVVRDSLLQMAGKLDLSTGGPSIDPEKAESTPRRSLYFVQTAHTEHRFLGAFDNSNVLECYRRNESVVPQQALALSNSKLSSDCAASLAGKLQSSSPDAFINEAFCTVLSRPPSKEESAASLVGFKALNNNKSLFVQALLNHNDFVTIR
ncbi:MAG: PSD1 domain-containing protein [Verrucomicrobiaceae bacterium]|nr:PSD1 domain-containing protein [Verrucomicrobiaceae bacterium]